MVGIRLLGLALWLVLLGLSSCFSFPFIERHSASRESLSTSPFSTSFSMTAKDAMADSTTTTAKSGDDENCSLSLWLLPSPQDPARETLNKAIQSFSQLPSASVPFQPHITLMGGIQCPSLEFFQLNILPKLRENLAKMGPIPCQFEAEPVMEAKWNQACVLVMDEESCSEFSNLVEVCRDYLMANNVLQKDDKGSTKENWYPPPLRRPHLSLYYGTEQNAPSPDQVKQQLLLWTPGKVDQVSFRANQVAVWRTDPPTTEGVAQWEQLAIIDLLATEK
ncbi:expressed unknown protein [Seminavis robusta]|uniref:2',3'-cyclic-nucleotide 3'-phosphodiesterase n=1 Tax=Seminavis robusta TaxID=568900 RepID=A0A9N8DAS0_9STRA|nr:expressed unknown protein [Seminavis robusta]|eukprot:Sro56_g032960.1 n/a (278) ;mRNA; f:115020-115853